MGFEFQDRFRNISRIMDCVGCEKCRLWGKLQILGIGTALKILMSDDQAGGYTLQRNEVVALLNTLGQLSASVQSIKTWRERELRNAILMGIGKLGGGVLVIGLSIALNRRRKRRAGETTKAAAEPTSSQGR